MIMYAYFTKLFVESDAVAAASQLLLNQPHPIELMQFAAAFQLLLNQPHPIELMQFAASSQLLL